MLETQEFVINLASAPLLHRVNAAAAKFAPEQGEPDHLEIAMEPSGSVAPPRVAASPASIECTLHSTTELGDSTMVLDPLARLGKDQWSLRPEVISVPRPQRPEDIV